MQLRSVLHRVLVGTGQQARRAGVAAPFILSPLSVAIAVPAVPVTQAQPINSAGFLVGTVATLLNDDAGAAQGYGAALSVDPGNPVLQHGTFFHALLAGDARAVALAAHQSTGVASYMRGNAAFLAGQWDQARDIFRTVPQDRIGQLLQPMLLGWTAIAAGRGGDPALRAEVERARSVVKAVVLHNTPLGDMTPASSRKTVAPSDGLALTYVLGALVVQEQQRTLSAHEQNLTRQLRDVERVMLRLALQVQPREPVARLLLAELLQDLEQGDAAVAAIGTINPHEPLAALLTYRLVLIEADRGDLTHARALLAELLRQQPRNPVLLRLSGDILSMMKKPDEARHAYDRAIAAVSPLQAGDWSLLLSRAVVLDHLGHWDLARADLDRAIKLAPDQPELLNYLGYSLVTRGESLVQARDLLTRALALDPTDAAIRDSVGWAQFRTGQVDEALGNLQQAAEKTPLDPTVNYHLGEVYLSKGRRVEAVDEFDRALHLNPDPADIKAIRRALDTLAPGTQKLGAAGAP